MKKINSLVLVLCLGLTIFSCSKESNVATTSKVDSVKVGIAKNDSTTSNKQIMAVGCKSPANVVTYPYPVGYTVIGTFPGAGSIYLQKGKVWRAGNYTLNFQSDGNLVIYNGSGQAIWDCPQAWTHNPTFALQSDGNFVAYENGTNPVWAAGTQDFACGGQIPRNMRLILTGLGDLEVISDGRNSYGLTVTCVLASTFSSQGAKLGTGAMTKMESKENPYGVSLFW